MHFRQTQMQSVAIRNNVFWWDLSQICADAKPSTIDTGQNVVASEVFATIFDQLFCANTKKFPFASLLDMAHFGGGDGCGTTIGDSRLRRIVTDDPPKKENAKCHTAEDDYQ